MLARLYTAVLQTLSRLGHRVSAAVWGLYRLESDQSMLACAGATAAVLAWLVLAAIDTSRALSSDRPLSAVCSQSCRELPALQQSTGNGVTLEGILTPFLNTIVLMLPGV